METDLDFTLSSAAVTDRGLSEKRPQNEDSFLELGKHGIFVVADGVGGAQAGDVASQMAVEIIGEAFVHRAPNADAEDTMRIAIERANAAIFQMATDLPQLSSMATTVVALQINHNVATIGHVGDSRLYSFDPLGRIRRETDDHSLVEEEVRAGRMTPDQALNHPSRNVISRALGAEQAVDVDLKTVMIEPGTTFLLCSDGITRHIPDPELEELFSANLDPKTITKQLRDICYNRGAEDNLTAVVVKAAGQETVSTAPDIDLGEDTITTARTNGVDAFAESADSYDESAGRIKEDQGETFADILDPDDKTFPANDDTFSDDGETFSDSRPAAVELPANVLFAAGDPPSRPPVSSEVPVTSSVSVHGAEPYGERIFSKLISAVFLLVIGGLVGAWIYRSYFVPPPIPEPPPALVEKSPDVPLTAFEESRRLVDKDPTAFLNANAASPQDAEDYFLLGRASLLSGKYWEAKRAFIEARNRLSQADPKNAKTLAADIALSIAVIESPAAAESFAKEIAASNTPTAGVLNTNASVDANSSGTVPFR